jgi:hypothetical protein
MCYLSPESALTSPDILTTKTNIHHYERMLDCKHIHYPPAPKPKIPLDEKRMPQPENKVPIETQPSSLGASVLDLVLAAIEKVSFHSDNNDTIPNDDEEDEEGVDKLYVVLTMENGKKNNGTMRLLHEEEGHAPTQLKRKRRSSRQQRHIEAAHEGDYASNVLLRFIGSIRAKDVKKNHEHKRSAPEHVLHREMTGMMRDRHEQDEIEDTHSLHSDRRRKRETHEDTHEEISDGARVKRHLKPLSAKERYMESQEDHETKNDRRRRSEAHVKESHGHDELPKSKRSPAKETHAHLEEKATRSAKKQKGKLVHGLDEAHLDGVQREDVMRVNHEEKMNKKRSAGKSKHRDHSDDISKEDLLRAVQEEQGQEDRPDHLSSARKEELLRVSHEEKIQKKHARSSKTKHFNDDHIRAAESEELMRVVGEENTPHRSKKQLHDNDERCGADAEQDKKQKKKSAAHKDKHLAEEKRMVKESLNEKHLQKAHDEELLRVRHEEKRSKSKSNVQHLDSAHHEELLRVQGDEMRARESRIPFDEQHLERARREELARIQHDERYHERKKAREAAGMASIEDRGLGLEKRHLDQAQQEELERLRHDEALLSEDERSIEEESGSGSGSDEIGSGDDSEDEGSGSGNWHWGPREVYVEDNPAKRNQELVENSEVWDSHAD